jgi:hypothetical protein
MKKTQFTETQIVAMLKQQEQGMKVSDIARANGTFELMARFYGPDKTFYTKTWKLGDVEKMK